MPKSCDYNEAESYWRVLKVAQLRWKNLYCFAYRFRLMKPKQAVLANFIDKIACGSGEPFYSTINHAFANLSSNDVVLQSLVNVHCKAFRDHLDGGEELEDRKHLPHDHAWNGVAPIKIGPERTICHVYGTLLVEHSEYFDRALKCSWKDAEEVAICLADVSHCTYRSAAGNTRRIMLIYISRDLPSVALRPEVSQLR